MGGGDEEGEGEVMSEVCLDTDTNADADTDVMK